jgi:hypothetical protein
MFGFTGVYISIYLFQHYINCCKGTCPRLFFYVNEICIFIQKRFLWIYFDFIMWISYIPFLYFSLLQLKNFSFETASKGISSLLSILIIVTYPLYPVLIAYLIKKKENYNDLCYGTNILT